MFSPAVILLVILMVDDEFKTTSPSFAVRLPTSTTPSSPTAVLLLITISPLFEIALLTSISPLIPFVTVILPLPIVVDGLVPAFIMPLVCVNPPTEFRTIFLPAERLSFISNVDAEFTVMLPSFATMSPISTIPFSPLATVLFVIEISPFVAEAWLIITSPPFWFVIVILPSPFCVAFKPLVSCIPSTWTIPPFAFNVINLPALILLLISSCLAEFKLT